MKIPPPTHPRWTKITRRGSGVSFYGPGNVSRRARVCVYFVFPHISPAVIDAARLLRGSVLTISVVSRAERTVCCGTRCSRPGSARNGLQGQRVLEHGVLVSGDTSTVQAGTLCYFVAAFQDLPPPALH